MKKNASILVAFAVSTIASNAATSIINLAGSANGHASFTSIVGITFDTGSLGGDTLLSSLNLAGATSSASTVGVGTTHFVQIYVDADNNATTWGLGTLVATSTNSQTITTNTTRPQFLWNFSGEALSSNQVYTIVFGGADGLPDDGTGDDIRMGTVTGNSITSTMFQNNGSIAQSGNEAAFTVNLIPEPSVVLFGSLGLLGLLRRRRN